MIWSNVVSRNWHEVTFQLILSFAKVIEVDPSTKKVVSEIRFENADMITSCAFGGPNLDELYVTSARIGDNVLPEVRRELLVW